MEWGWAPPRTENMRRNVTSYLSIASLKGIFWWFGMRLSGPIPWVNCQKQPTYVWYSLVSFNIRFCVPFQYCYERPRYVWYGLIWDSVTHPLRWVSCWRQGGVFAPKPLFANNLKLPPYIWLPHFFIAKANFKATWQWSLCPKTKNMTPSSCI